jgi:hypothetical protein
MGSLGNIPGRRPIISGPPILPPTFCSCGITMKIYQKEVCLTGNIKLAYSKSSTANMKEKGIHYFKKVL